ncbi:hypothetical protein [Enterococcus sp. CWB-B31]|uniref:hypothetical protein n=1 Tax=Enterococcus sp. CWB-B31 TaxID=2885159 RepID=UPI001E5A2A7F|nr:hypothetical protein [Enterococcus sp. CWB-B31]MCB5956433.1 hypothetical protein [Enterococcus sp. CWB-B31]
METERKSRCEYAKLDGLIMSISSILWNMISIYSGNSCPVTDQYDMRDIILRDEKETKCFLEECEQYGYLQDIFGEKFETTLDKYMVFPVTKDHLLAVGDQYCE